MSDNEACDLATKHCVPCRGGIPPLQGAELAKLSAALGGGWQVLQAHHLSKTYIFKNFADGLAFVNRLGEVAEREGHHPDIFLTWGKVRVDVWTHKIDGLTESDFILAAKADTLERQNS